ncbi:transglutaminase domain-containing protein [candidate division KSB1 bacterium]|nr:transglutaminase domain-containing protein [candidate division KSB1 bacterium]
MKIRSLIEEGKSNPFIRTVTAQIIGDGRDYNYMKHLERLYLWIKNNIRYIYDIQALETFQSAHLTLFTIKAGDCDDLTILSAAMLESCGFPTKLMYLVKKINGVNYPIHIWLKVGIPPLKPINWIDFDSAERSLNLGENYKKLNFAA